jgi:4-hydroxy-tetrahydrodipicolinate reductase
VSDAGAAVRIGVVGALGRMGERVRAAVAADPATRLGALLEGPGSPGVGSEVDGLVVTSDPTAAVADADAMIDFSAPQATLAALAAAAEARVPYAAGTTGFTPDQRAELERLAGRTPVVLAANFSVSVNVLAHLARRAADLLGEGFDAEIVELHHAQKRDAPSGTALWLGEAIAAARGTSLEKAGVLARQGEVGVRPPGAIGIQALRGGDNPGEHVVHFVGRGERVELAHRSATRDHFAAGAVRAARWLVGRDPGLYTMADVLGLTDPTERS